MNAVSKHRAHGKVISVQDEQPKSDGLIVLKNALFNKKLGGFPKRSMRIKKGPHKGMPLFSLTLEERATCNTECQQWSNCYGDKMRYAKRYDTDGIEDVIDHDLEVLFSRYPQVSIRLHILGDFFSVQYVEYWEEKINQYSGLYVWGFTHWPWETEIGRSIVLVSVCFPKQFAISISDFDSIVLPRAVVVDHWNTDTGVACLNQVDDRGCVDCGICMSPSHNTVQFLRH